MIKNIRALAGYLELEGATEAHINEYLSDKIGGWAKVLLPTKQAVREKVQTVQATGRLTSSAIMWSQILIEGNRCVKDYPQDVLDYLDASVVKDSLTSPLEYGETLDQLANRPTTHYKIIPTPDGFDVIFKAKCPVYKNTRECIVLGKGSREETLVFPFSEEAWDRTVKDLRFY